MTNFKHLTATELLAYSLGSLEKDESQTFGRHLLTCAECRELLPMPSFERIWAAVMMDSETTDAPQKEDSENFLSSLSSFLKSNNGFAWSGAALILIFCFSFLFWFGSKDSGREVVQAFDNQPGSDFNFPLPAQTPNKERLTSQANPNRAESASVSKNLKPDISKPKILPTNPSQDFKKPNQKKSGETVSATRGVSAKCSEKREVETELSMSKENLVFKWKKIPKAAKYHLYISDDDEILIDEFETDTETTFVLKKKLDPLKTYKWKIIVTLENGQTIPGPSNKFTVKDFQNKQMKSEKTRNADVRCSANS